MECIPEPENHHDRQAVCVVAPPLAAIPRSLHHRDTRPPPQQQTVQDIASATIGRVPSGLCSFFSVGLTANHYIERVEAVYTGHMLHDGPVRGGGPKLQCAYIITFSQHAPVVRLLDYLHYRRQIASDDIFCWLFLWHIDKTENCWMFAICIKSTVRHVNQSWGKYLTYEYEYKYL